MIEENQYKQIAEMLDLEIAIIKAVKEVESKGEGFLSSGEPIILFEPHIFWRELKKKGLSPSKYKSDICYERWGEKPYGKISEQHNRLSRAVKIDKDCAFKAASWGLFQILGNNYDLCGFVSVQEFINAMYRSEYDQLFAFANYVKNRKLDRFLKKKDWASFSKAYNGPGYIKNNYHIKLEKAYNKYK